MKRKIRYAYCTKNEQGLYREYSPRFVSEDQALRWSEEFYPRLFLMFGRMIHLRKFNMNGFEDNPHLFPATTI
jgi:hypothetical protein